jgi:hypothetical protein
MGGRGVNTRDAAGRLPSAYRLNEQARYAPAFGRWRSTMGQGAKSKHLDRDHMSERRHSDQTDSKIGRNIGRNML